MKVIIFVALLGLLTLPQGESLSCYQCNLLDPTCFSEPKKHQAIFCGSNESAAGGLMNAFVDENVVSILQDVEKLWLPIAESLRRGETMVSVLHKLKKSLINTDQLIRNNGKIPQVVKNFYLKIMEKITPKAVKSLKTIYKTVMDIVDSEEMRDVMDEMEEMMKKNYTLDNTGENDNQMLQLTDKIDEQTHKITILYVAIKQKLTPVWKGLPKSTQDRITSTWKPIVNSWENDTPPTKAQFKEAWTVIDEIIRGNETLEVWRNFYQKIVDTISQNNDSVIEATETIYNTLVEIEKSKEIDDAFDEVMKYFTEKFKQSSYIPKEIVDVKILKNSRIQTNQKFICYKKVAGINSTQVSRGCMDASAKCEEKDKCFSCNSDDCNSSSSIQIGIITIFFSVLLALVLAR